MFLYELLPESPFFLECNSFTSPDPHKVRPPWRLVPDGTTGLPCPLVAIWASTGACGSGSESWAGAGPEAVPSDWHEELLLELLRRFESGCHTQPLLKSIP